MNEAFSKSYHELFGVEPLQQITYGDSNAEIFSEARGFMGGFNLTMQVQIGCPCACLFCYVRTAARLAPKDVRGTGGIDWGFVVKDKLNVLGKLKRHITKRNLADNNIYWSGVTDPYAASPKVTKGIWNHLSEASSALKPRRLVVQTRLRPDRDFKEIARYRRNTRPSDGGARLL